ncbi:MULTISPECIES: DNA primase [unclassified Streptomyces]|uniref:DNA primase n=1 Tax=unclassified Streptomyces TaxID=2593676 RepID=UPI00093F607F|nr:DNA primase [Streptomyces sp. CB02400]OKK13964.1 DNA primase [Streptomyces sp. CB02400]
MNRMGLGLAIGAGYLLGRTKKLKMAVAVGGLVAGKKLNLGPRMVADLVSQQLRDNPQFKEIGDQLRGDLRGVGKAASGALVERQLDSLADRLHGRTADMRDRLTGAGPRDDADAEHAEDAEHEDAQAEDREPPDEPAPERPAKKAQAKKAQAKKAAPAKKAAAKKTAPAKKTAAKKTAAAARGARSRTAKGGDE